LQYQALVLPSNYFVISNYVPLELLQPYIFVTLLIGHVWPISRESYSKQYEYSSCTYFSAITPHDRGIKTGIAQTISCTLAGLGDGGDDSAATVKWIGPDDQEIKSSDSNYIIDDGTGSYSAGSQTSKLTLKSSKTQISTAQTYKCSVTSGYYPGSPTFKQNVVVTPIGECLSLYKVNFFSLKFLNFKASF
jgi:hypothetical protein